MIGLYCHHTCIFKKNTGIQRCFRSIANSIYRSGEKIVPFVWNFDSSCLEFASKNSCENLSLWGGPPYDAWTFEIPPPGSTLLIIELISGPYHPSQARIVDLAHEFRWKLVGIFHDAIPIQWGGDSKRFHMNYMSGLANYDLVLATSGLTKCDLENFWNANHLDVNAQLDILTLPAEIPGSTRILFNPSRPVFCGYFPIKLLFVGSLEPRKNHLSLFKAMAWLKAFEQLNIDLQLVGWANDQRVVEELVRAKKRDLPVRWNHDTSDDELLKYYEACHLTIFPSLQEGFGLPVMESLWMGRPCLTGAHLVSLRPTELPGCIVIDSTNWKEIAKSLIRIQKQPAQINLLAKEISLYPLRSWAQYVNEMLERISCIN